MENTPEFPLIVQYVEDGTVVEEVEVPNLQRLITDIEEFDTDDPSCGKVYDALHRPVRVQVKIWEEQVVCELIG